MLMRLLLYGLLPFILLLAALPVLAQAGGTTVEGRVIDSAGTDLEGATVRLYHAKDSTALFTVTTGRGGYLFRRVKPGAYKLVISYAGFATESVQAEITAQKSQILEPVQLKRTYQELENVEVKSTPAAIAMRGDTLIYRADAYPVRANSNVQGLLKRLPGIEVSADGAITYQGKPIEKIYINGKDYYLNDPRLLSQNLSADIVAKIELFDMPLTSKNALKPPGERSKVLDLKLKKGVSLALSGKGYAGATHKGEYGAGASAQSFINTRTIIANLNHNSYNDIYRGGGEEEIFAQMGLLQGKSIHTNGLIYFNNVWGKLRTNLNYGYDKRRTENENLTEKLSFLGDSSLFERINNTNSSVNQTHFMSGSFDLVSDSSFGNINYSPTLRVSSTNNYSNNKQVSYARKPGIEYMLNEGIADNRTEGREVELVNNLSYFKVFRLRAISFRINQSDASNRASGSINNISRFFNAAGDTVSTFAYDQQFIGRERRKSFMLSIEDRETLSRNTTLNIAYSFSQNTNQRERYSYNLNPATHEYDELDSLSTIDFKSVVKTHRLMGRLSQQWGEFTFSAGTGFASDRLTNNDLFNSGLTTETSFNNFLPNASVRFSRKGTQLNLSYEKGTILPMIDQLQPVTDRSNPFLIRVGNPGLKQQSNHRFSLSYSGNNLKKLSFYGVNIQVEFSNDRIVSFTNVLPGGVQETGLINRDGGSEIMLRGNYHFGLDRKNKMVIKLMGGLRYTKDFTITNGIDNIRKTLTIDPNIEIMCRLIHRVQLKARANYNYTVSEFTIKSAFNAPQQTHEYSLNGSWELPWQLLLGSGYSIRMTASQGVLRGNTIQRLNAFVAMNVFKNNKGEVRLAGYDLLNVAEGISQYASENYIISINNNTIGRQFLLVFTWHFRR